MGVDVNADVGVNSIVGDGLGSVVKVADGCCSAVTVVCASTRGAISGVSVCPGAVLGRLHACSINTTIIKTMELG